MPFDPKIKVIVVDDMAVMRKMVTKILKDLKFENVDSAENGSQAFEKIVLAHESNVPFQLVISDWNMPVMTGIDLLAKLREREEFKKLPFLMVTAEGEKDNLITAIKAGVSNFIVKPFTPDTLKEKIFKIIK